MTEKRTVNMEPVVTCRSAVLLIVFNRPNSTKKVLEAIREAGPPRLYVAADGPRKDRPGENELCEEARTIATNIDWDCELLTLMSDKNLGCRFGPQTAIDWFFEHEAEGIILEDDCLPHQDFFGYCDWALETYKNEKSVWHINGNNFDAPARLYDKKLSFSALAQVWGWATWRDRWNRYCGNPFKLKEDALIKKSAWKLSTTAKMNKYNHILSLQKGLDAWDFQWQIKILNENGLCLSCSSNLISNLGDGEGATHTQNDQRIRLPIKNISGDLEYIKPRLNKRLTRWYESRMGLHSIRGLLAYLFKTTSQYLKRILVNTVSHLLYFGVKPIVVASTGRSGSTLLFDSLAESLIVSRFRIKYKSWLGQILINFTKGYIDRIWDIESTSKPILKTHDLFRQEYTDKARYIFIFGDPLESAQSVEVMVNKHDLLWLDEHLYHLCANGSIVELYEKDILNYENQMKSWCDNKNGAIFTLSFDDLWNSTEKLSRFVGFEIKLPARRQRESKPSIGGYNQELFAHLRRVMCSCMPK